jgi:flagellar M-ring protein FliF
VGADATRGDQIAVIARNFEPLSDQATPFYEAPWFATVLRNAVALIAVLLVLLLGVRPLIKALRRDPAASPANAEGEADGGAQAQAEGLPKGPLNEAIDSALLSQQVGLAQRLVQEKPDSAVAALREMLNNQPEPEVSQ